MDIVCKFCNSSNLKKRGVVANKQRFQCLSCLKTFRIGDDRQKYTDSDKEQVVEAYLKSKNLRNTSLVVGPSTPIVSKWLKELETSIKQTLIDASINFNIKEVMIIEQEYSENTSYKILIEGKNITIIKKKSANVS